MHLRSAARLHVHRMHSLVVGGILRVCGISQVRTKSSLCRCQRLVFSSQTPSSLTHAHLIICLTRLYSRRSVGQWRSVRSPKVTWMRVSFEYFFLYNTYTWHLEVLHELCSVSSVFALIQLDSLTWKRWQKTKGGFQEKRLTAPADVYHGLNTKHSWSW